MGAAGSGGSTGGAGATGGAGTTGDAGATGSVGTTGSAGTGGAAGSIGGTPKETALARLLALRQEHAVVALAGEIYVIGGYVSNAVSNSVQAYNPGADRWRDVKNFPVPLQHPNAGVVGNKAYVAGFYRTTGTTSTSAQTFEYDPTTDGWTEKAPLPSGTGRAAGCAAVDAGLFYVFGGAIDGTSVADASRYDPATDKWETLPALPGPREHCAAGAINGTLYVAGGRVDEIVNVRPDTWAFDPVAKTWRARAPMLKPRGGLASAVLAGRLFGFGGEGNAASNIGIFNDIDVYDPVTNTWSALPPMLVPRHGFGAATIGQRIYLAGGANRQGGFPSTENSVFFFE